MYDDESRRKTEAVMREAKQAIANAEQALSRTDAYFAQYSLTPEKLMAFLQAKSGPNALRELENTVERTLREARAEARQAVEAAQVQQAVKSVRRRIRSLI